MLPPPFGQSEPKYIGVGQGLGEVLEPRRVSWRGKEGTSPGPLPGLKPASSGHFQSLWASWGPKQGQGGVAEPLELPHVSLGCGGAYQEGGGLRRAASQEWYQEERPRRDEWGLKRSTEEEPEVTPQSTSSLEPLLGTVPWQWTFSTFDRQSWSQIAQMFHKSLASCYTSTW